MIVTASISTSRITLEGTMSVVFRHIANEQSSTSIESKHIVVIQSSKSITRVSTLMRHHHILLRRNHTFISYKTLDYDQMSLSRASDDMKEKLFVCMRKFKNDPQTITCENLVKIERSRIKGSWT